MTHPQLAARSCSECQRWMYDDRGDQMGPVMLDRKGNPRPRPSGTATPCWKCPKKSPQHAGQFELSNRNRRAVSFYFEVQGSGGMLLTDAMRTDAILRRNLGIIEWVMRSHERSQLATLSLLPAIARGK